MDAPAAGAAPCRFVTSAVRGRVVVRQKWLERSSPARSPALPESLLDHRKRLAGDGEYGRPGGALLIRGEREIHAAIAAAGAGGDGDPGVGARRGPGAAGVGQHSDAAAGCALNDLRAAHREGVAAAAVEGEIG